MDFIESQKTLYPDLAEEYDKLLNLHVKKLWHQLSLALEEFLSISNKRENNFLALYDDFICSFETRLNQIKLSKLLYLIGNSLADPSESLAFYKRVVQSRDKLGVEASLCLDMDTAVVLLKLNQVEEAKKLLDDAQQSLSTIKSTEPVTFSKYYLAFVEYKKVVGPPQDFYNAGLMFLSYTPVEDLDQEMGYKLATDMALASIIGEDIFNFGEVIATPILLRLKETPNEWLHDLVYALYEGDLEQLNSIIEKNKAHYNQHPALEQQHDTIKQKAALLCTMNIAFERPSNDRQISFVDIANATRLPIDQVEWILMRAMSLGLIKGVIDEVDQVVNVTWVQPRVLDKQRIGLLVEQLGGWTERVKQALVTIEDQTHELFV